MHGRWDDPELRAAVKLGVMTFGYLLVLGLGWLAFFLWWD
jgi:hypothetical protein